MFRRTISLWTTTRKKAVFRQSLAHGFDESHADTEDVDVVRKPRWITAIGCLRYSDLFASGVFSCRNISSNADWLSIATA